MFTSRAEHRLLLRIDKPTCGSRRLVGQLGWSTRKDGNVSTGDGADTPQIFNASTTRGSAAHPASAFLRAVSFGNRRCGSRTSSIAALWTSILTPNRTTRIRERRDHNQVRRVSPAASDRDRAVGSGTNAAGSRQTSRSAVCQACRVKSSSGSSRCVPTPWRTRSGFRASLRQRWPCSDRLSADCHRERGRVRAQAPRARRRRVSQHSPEPCAAAAHVFRASCALESADQPDGASS